VAVVREEGLPDAALGAFDVVVGDPASSPTGWVVADGQVDEAVDHLVDVISGHPQASLIAAQGLRASQDASPQDANRAGNAIRMNELGGGYRPSDIQRYFQAQGIQTPSVKSVSVNQATNRPTTPQSADGEVMLDIEVAGSVAPAAAIVVYFAPNTARGFQDALSTAIHDQLNKPCAVSISWGSAESTWTAQSMQNFDQVAQEAALMGITITVAAGDNGFANAYRDG
jgi:hypothetical protein